MLDWTCHPTDGILKRLPILMSFIIAEIATCSTAEMASAREE